jgi:cytoskeleton protein RodZ
MSEKGTFADSTVAGAEAEGSLGLRLKRAREMRGWSAADVAAKLRLKHGIVEALEAERLGALGAPVFVRGYYGSYTRLLGLPCDSIDSLIGREAAPEPVLSSSTHISHGRHLLDRYKHRAVYLVVTVSIVVPLILLATRDHLPESSALLAPLDAPATDATRTVAVDTGFIGGDAEQAALTVARTQSPMAEQPVMASLTPFYSPARTAPVPAQQKDEEAESFDGLTLRFNNDSWVEVVGKDGKRLEHNLLRAGETRRFARDAVGNVLLGNASGVEVLLDGERVNLEPYRRANVARFEVSSDGSLAPVGG